MNPIRNTKIIDLPQIFEAQNKLEIYNLTSARIAVEIYLEKTMELDLPYGWKDIPKYKNDTHYERWQNLYNNFIDLDNYKFWGKHVYFRKFYSTVYPFMTKEKLEEARNCCIDCAVTVWQCKMAPRPMEEFTCINRKNLCDFILNDENYCEHCLKAFISFEYFSWTE